MSVVKFSQPDRTTKTLDAAGAQAWMGEIEAAVGVLNSSPMSDFAPYAATPVSMTVNVSAGILGNSLGLKANSTTGGASEGVNVVSAGVQSVSFTAPATNPRIDRICLDALTGVVETVTGTEAVIPVAPLYLDGVIPVGQVSLSVGQTVITNAHITDERGLINCDSPAGGSGGVSTAFGSAVGYEIFDVAGTYSFTKPAQANFYRLTLIGAGGGSGGYWYTSSGDYYRGGCGGGGGCIAGLVVSAEDVTITIGDGGIGGTRAFYPDAATVITKGGDGVATAVVGNAVGTISANGGKGGSPATRTPNVGAGGDGGVATFGGFAGGVGATGAINANAPFGGTTGEYGQINGAYLRMGAGGGGYGSGGDGFVLIEWF